MKRLIELSKSEIKNSLLVLLEVLINAKKPTKAELDEIKDKVSIEKYEVLLDDCRISREPIGKRNSSFLFCIYCSGFHSSYLKNNPIKSVLLVSITNILEDSRFSSENNTL